MSRCARTSGRSGCSRSGCPLATAFAVGFVAYHTVPALTPAAALTLGAIVAPPDAVSATAVGRRLGLPRQMMTLLGGESLLNDATALTAVQGRAGGRDRHRGRLALRGWAPLCWPPPAGSWSGGCSALVIDFIRSRLSTIR